MTCRLAPPVLALLFVAGCGSAPRAGTAARAPVCPVDSSLVTSLAAQVDLDGDGRPDELGLDRDPADCGGALVAQLGRRVVFGQIPRGEPPVRTAFAVKVAGHRGDLLVTRQDHPRGGFQVRVFALRGNELVELQANGRPLLPFLATDVQEHPLSVDCADGGVVVTEAVAHEPVGVLFAWDVRRTSYTLDGAKLGRGSSQEVADNVLPRQLESRYPALVAHAIFARCR